MIFMENVTLTHLLLVVVGNRSHQTFVCNLSKYKKYRLNFVVE